MELSSKAVSVVFKVGDSVEFACCSVTAASLEDQTYLKLSGTWGSMNKKFPFYPGAAVLQQGAKSRRQNLRVCIEPQ